MKRIVPILLATFTLALGACGGEDGTQDTLTDGRREDPRDPGATAGDEGTTYDHSNDPGGAVDDTSTPAVRVVGSPEVTSRLHACGKLSYASLGQILASRGMGASVGRPQNSPSAQQIYGASAPALGAPNYGGRVSEAPFASTSAMSKSFDIFAMASYDVAAPTWAPSACPDVKLLGTDGKFAKDALSCLIGKPASDEHVAIANDALAKNPTDGVKIAVLAILAAAHTCQ